MMEIAAQAPMQPSDPLQESAKQRFAANLAAVMHVALEAYSLFQQGKRDLEQRIRDFRKQRILQRMDAEVRKAALGEREKQLCRMRSEGCKAIRKKFQGGVPLNGLMSSRAFILPTASASFS